MDRGVQADLVLDWDPFRGVRHPVPLLNTVIFLRPFETMSPTL